MGKVSGRLVAPGKWRKTCKECLREFVGGRRAEYDPACRKKLKAWRAKTRREVRRAKLGLFPGQRVARLWATRKRARRPGRRNSNRYRAGTCEDCGAPFFAGFLATRCLDCLDRDRRKKQARYDRNRRPRAGRPRGTEDARTQNAASAA